MTTLNIPLTSKHKILALGPESAGNFSVYSKKQIQLSPDFSDLLNVKNWQKYQRAVSNFLHKNKIKPTLIITDLHPIYKTTIYGQQLAKKYKAKFVQVQHHQAHICSALGEYLSEGHELPTKLVGIACDGTGYGTDGIIWGGEVFQMSNVPARTTDWKFDVRSGGQCPMFNKSQILNPKSQINPKFQSAHTKPTSYPSGPEDPLRPKDKLQATSYQIERIGSLEPQILIGGDLAIREPARVLLATLRKAGLSKAKIWQYLKKHYNKNKFELLYNQLLQNFNCQPTTSTARILDAASLLLGFCQNIRHYKHEPALLLEKNSCTGARLAEATAKREKFCPPATRLASTMSSAESSSPKSDRHGASTPYTLNAKRYHNKYTNRYEISTTKLFQYLLKNLHRDKHRLAATVQLYLAKGLHEIVRNQMSNVQCPILDKSQIQNPKSQTISKHQIPNNYELRPRHEGPRPEGTTNYELFFSGGLAANKIMKEFMTKKGAITNKKLPCGDASISFGQIIFYLTTLA